MNRYCKAVGGSLVACHLRLWLPLLTLLVTSNVWSADCPGGHHNIDFGTNCDNVASTWECTFAFSSTDRLVATDGVRIAAGLPGGELSGLAWTYGKVTGTCGSLNACTATAVTPQECLGIFIDTTNVSGSDVPYDRVLLNGTVNTSGGSQGCFELMATRPSDGKACKRQFKFHITTSVHGWGEPHIVTADGESYDFQSVGEFIALRGDDLEIQTRQSAFATQRVPEANEYTGIASCVSIYTAVAARVGQHRVSIQQKANRTGDLSDVQIRVDGDLRTLGPEGIELSSCDCPAAEIKSDGRIIRAADERTIEIHYANGAKLVVIPSWWEPQQTWWFNVHVYDTTAKEGIMGLTKDGWLPALHDRSSLGGKPEDLHERYVQLYETFADSWRVGGEEKPSLFDYEEGTSTETFTMAGWPGENPSNCLIDGVTPLEPVSESVAEEACSEVMGEKNQANCVFDVRETGNTGFAEAYVRSEQLIPGATRTTLVQDKTSSQRDETVSFTATVQRKVSTIGKVTSGRVLFVLDGKNVGDPIAFDTNGNAVWRASSLGSGSHEVEARFLPTGFGERFRSSSAKVNHVVSGDWWLSFHVGRTEPTGDFGDLYEGGDSVVLDLEYKLTPMVSFLGLLGYNQFEAAQDGLDDINWTNLSANIKYYMARYGQIGTLWVNAGVGAYIPDSDSTRAGTNAGFGFQGNINKRTRWEAGVNYYNVFTSGGDTTFAVPTVGVTYHF